MQKRFQNKIQRQRARKSVHPVANEPQEAGEIITGWRSRRVPIRRFSEKALAKSRPAGTAASRKQRAAPKRASEFPAFQHILVPIDFSAHSARALKFAAALAKRNDSNVTLVHVVGPIHDLRDFEYAKRRLSTLAQKHLEARLEWQPVVRSGNGPNQILQEADQMEADVIVLSTRGLSQAPTSKIGSIAKHIVRNSPCPVLILPGREKVKTKRARMKK